MEERNFWRKQMTQKDLWSQFGFECDRLKDCRNVIQNEFRDGLAKDQADKLIKEFEMFLNIAERDLRTTAFQIKEFIWSQIK